ncbi:MAG: hypothetical protein ACKPHU_29905, partial [Planctomycetaceae bacterium]
DNICKTNPRRSPRSRASHATSQAAQTARPVRSPQAKHATVDGNSDLPLLHTRDATTLLCSTAHDDN